MTYRFLGVQRYEHCLMRWMSHRTATVNTPNYKCVVTCQKLKPFVIHTSYISTAASSKQLTSRDNRQHSDNTHRSVLWPAGCMVACSRRRKDVVIPREWYIIKKKKTLLATNRSSRPSVVHSPSVKPSTRTSHRQIEIKTHSYCYFFGIFWFYTFLLLRFGIRFNYQTIKKMSAPSVQ